MFLWTKHFLAWLSTLLLVSAAGGCLCQLPHRSLEPRKLYRNTEAGRHTLLGQFKDASSKLHHSKLRSDSELRGVPWTSGGYLVSHLEEWRSLCDGGGSGVWDSDELGPAQTIRKTLPTALCSWECALTTSGSVVLRGDGWSRSSHKTVSRGLPPASGSQDVPPFRQRGRLGVRGAAFHWQCKEWARTLRSASDPCSHLRQQVEESSPSRSWDSRSV